MKKPVVKWAAQVCGRCTRMGPRGEDFACALSPCPPETIRIRGQAAYAALCTAVLVVAGSLERVEVPPRRALDRKAAERTLRVLRQARRLLTAREVRDRARLASTDAANSCLKRLRRRGLAERRERGWALRARSSMGSNSSIRPRITLG